MSKPSFLSHLTALLMPVTMALIIPLWLISQQKYSFVSIFERAGGILLIIVGLALFTWTMYLFIRVGKGTLAPWNATNHFIATGPYKYWRNPMISGVLMIILGETLFFNSIPVLFWGLILFLVNTIYFIVLEEPYLSRKFGKSYDTYKSRVPRWLPSFHTVTK